MDGKRGQWGRGRNELWHHTAQTILFIAKRPLIT